MRTKRPRRAGAARYNAACRSTAAPHRPRASSARAASIFGIVLASFVLSFFHRTAPAAIAGELTRAFAINSAVLGTLAATYFYVYTLLQIPVGVLADTLGPRRILTVGSLVAGAGSLAFALAPTWEIAAAGRTLVGVGVVGRVHRDPQGQRRLVSGQPLRDAERHHACSPAISAR